MTAINLTEIAVRVRQASRRMRTLIYSVGTLCLEPRQKYYVPLGSTADRLGIGELPKSSQTPFQDFVSSGPVQYYVLVLS